VAGESGGRVLAGKAGGGGLGTVQKVSSENMTSPLQLLDAWIMSPQRSWNVMPARRAAIVSLKAARKAEFAFRPRTEAVVIRVRLEKKKHEKGEAITGPAGLQS
jgi:hypothetical protein